MANCRNIDGTIFMSRQRPLTLVCRYANKEAPVVLPETIDTCVMDYDERRVHCF